MAVEVSCPSAALCGAEPSRQLPSAVASALPSPGTCQRDKRLDHQQILLHEAPRQRSSGFSLDRHGEPEGQAVRHQAGVNQVDVLGRTKIPAGIRGSLLSHGQDRHFGFTAEKGKLRLRTPRRGAGPEQDPVTSPAGARERTPSQGKDRRSAVTCGGVTQCQRDDRGRSRWPRLVF